MNNETPKSQDRKGPQMREFEAHDLEVVLEALERRVVNLRADAKRDTDGDGEASDEAEMVEHVLRELKKNQNEQGAVVSFESWQMERVVNALRSMEYGMGRDSDERQPILDLIKKLEG